MKGVRDELAELFKKQKALVAASEGGSRIDIDQVKAFCRDIVMETERGDSPSLVSKEEMRKGAKALRDEFAETTKSLGNNSAPMSDKAVKKVVDEAVKSQYEDIGSLARKEVATEFRNLPGGCDATLSAEIGDLKRQIQKKEDLACNDQFVIHGLEGKTAAGREQLLRPIIDKPAAKDRPLELTSATTKTGALAPVTKRRCCHYTCRQKFGGLAGRRDRATAVLGHTSDNADRMTTLAGQARAKPIPGDQGKKRRRVKIDKQAGEVKGDEIAVAKKDEQKRVAFDALATGKASELKDGHLKGASTPPGRP